uniref:Uncharacterized protein n=1 Tax=Geospiza parvula TaxID=87175 RepID=A0A8U8B8F6_GEOPR
MGSAGRRRDSTASLSLREAPTRVTDPEPDPLVLQVPAQALLEGDTVTLRCRCQQDNHLTWVTKLSLSSLQLHHSGRYGCEGLVGSWQSRSAAVTVTAHGVPLSGVSLSVQPPGGQVALGDCLVLSCTVATGTGPLSFSWHREGSGAPLGTDPPPGPAPHWGQ